MKTARFVPVTMVVFFVLAVRADADPASAPNPYIQSDGDGVPLIITTRQSQSESDSSAADQQQAKNKDWLVHGYEHAMQSHRSDSSNGDSSGGASNDLYYQLSSNKDLARLAGLPTTDDSDDATKSLRTGATPSGHSAIGLRQEAAPASTFSPNSFMKPFLSPMNAPINAGAQSFYNPLPFALPSSLLGGGQSARSRSADQSLSSTDLETPGMVAQEKDPLTDANDPTIDALPGESPEQARAHQDNYSKLELSLPMNSDEFHKQQTAALTPSVPSKTTKTTATAMNAPQPPTPPNTDADPLPVNTIPITPMRSPIANPFDILNR